MGTHFLGTTEGGTCQDMEWKRLSNRHSLPGDRRGGDLLGHGKKPTEQRVLTNWSRRGRDLSGHRMEPTERRALTNWRPQKEGLFRTWKESDQAMDTHVLEIVEGRAHQDTERK